MGFLESPQELRPEGRHQGRNRSTAQRHRCSNDEIQRESLTLPFTIPSSIYVTFMQIQMNMEMTRGQIESRAIQERDKAELREVLQGIVKSTDDMKALLSMQTSNDSRPIEEMMETLQTVKIILCFVVFGSNIDQVVEPYRS